jgi:hypothetical protein
MMGDQIKYKEGYKYQLAEDCTLVIAIRPQKPIVTDWIMLSPNGLLIIRKGYAWDGASGPTIDTKSTMRGSLVHDALYQLMRMEMIPEACRIYADQLLHDICVEDGMWSIRANVWEKMVNWFAAGCAKAGTEKPIITAP